MQLFSDAHSIRPVAAVVRHGHRILHHLELCGHRRGFRDTLLSFCFDFAVILLSFPSRKWSESAGIQSDWTVQHIGQEDSSYLTMSSGIALRSPGSSTRVRRSSCPGGIFERTRG